MSIDNNNQNIPPPLPPRPGGSGIGGYDNGFGFNSIQNNPYSGFNQTFPSMGNYGYNGM